MIVSTRTMTKNDLETVMALEKEIFSTPWTRNTFLMELRRPNGEYIVAEIQNQVVGYSGMVREGRDFHLTTMAIDPAFRRRGIATQLMLIHIDEALAEGARRFLLEVKRSNVEAQSFYQRFGFEAGGSVINYYSSEGEDAVVMWVPDFRDKEFLGRVSGMRRALEEELTRKDVPD